MSHLRRLAEAATRGPWHVDAMDDGGDFSGGKNYHVVSGGQSVAMCPEDLFGGVEPFDGSPWQSKRNAAFIAAASPDVLIALMDRAEAAERERDSVLATLAAQRLGWLIP